MALSVAIVTNALTMPSARAAYDAELRWSAQQFATTDSTVGASLATDAGTLDTTAIASLDTNVEAVVRLESAWSTQLDDSPISPMRLRVGDTISNPGEWGSAVRFAGVQFGTAFNLRSDLIGGERFALAGIAIVPSTTDAWFAAHRVAQTALTQRGVHVVGAASVVGADKVNFSVRDAVGRSIDVSRPLVANNDVAPVGCRNFSFGVGHAREDYGVLSNSYGPLFANSTITCGTEFGLTIEAHDEYLAGNANIAGLNLSHAVGRAGSAAIAVATSRNEFGSGWLVRMNLRHRVNVLDVQLRARVQSPEFRDLGQNSNDEAVAKRLVASVGGQVTEHGTLALAYANQTTYDDARIDILGLTQTFNFGRKGTLSLIAAHTAGAENDLSVRLGYLKALGAHR